MKYSYCLAALAAFASAAPTDKLFTIETAPGETRQVTEEEKFSLKADGINFFDITEWPETATSAAPVEKRQAVPYPSTLTQGTTVQALNAKLSSSNMRTKLTRFTEFNNRYYTQTTGRQSSEWLLEQVKSYIPAGSVATAAAFTHSWAQSSIIAKIPGKSTKTIVVGAHQDSTAGSATARAPGADDDGSGSMTILEAFRTLLTDSKIASGQAAHTIEFHWYAGEEAGLLGSQAIFNNYKSAGRNVVAMLNQDMTGYTGGYDAQGVAPKFGIITDNVNAALTTFTKKVIDAYTNTAWVDDRCAYACSDHASATRAGYPSAFVFESEFDLSSPYIHSSRDTIQFVNFDHMLEHARVVNGFVVELANATL